MKKCEMKVLLSGFTLIELLVVVAIIGLLAALLLPVVQSSLRKGRTITSISNLKQIHMMFETYVGDNRGRYPLPVDPDSGSFWRLVLWEHNFGAFKPSNIYEQMQRSTYAQVMWCPLMVKRYGQEQHDAGRGSYAMNAYFDEDERFVSGASFTGSQEPFVVAGQVLDNNGRWGTNERFLDLEGGEGSWQTMAFEYGSDGDVGLGLFVDGHVEQITRDRASELNELVLNRDTFD
jgi:prepilin-type N-terminal cleavage/methylation domain-containing protein